MNKLELVGELNFGNDGELYVTTDNVEYDIYKELHEIEPFKSCRYERNDVKVRLTIEVIEED